MLPQTTEQKGVCERVCQLGAGIKLERSDIDSILEAINKIFLDTSYRKNAQAIAEGFQACSGAKGAADKIIEVCEMERKI